MGRKRTVMQKDNIQGALARVDRYLKAAAGTEFGGDDEAFISSLSRASVSVAGAARSYGIVLAGDTVIAESGWNGAGDTWAPEGESRRIAARAATQLAKTKVEEHGPNHAKAAGIESNGDRLLIPFRLSEQRAGAVLLEHATPAADGSLTLDLAVALVLGAAQTRRLAATEREAVDSSRRSEARIKEMEKQVASGGVGAVAYLKPMADLERDAIELALRSTHWNKEEAARRLGISRASIYMKVKKMGLQRPV